MKNALLTRNRQTAARIILSMAVILTITLSMFFRPGNQTLAANPTGGSLAPTVGATVAWVGTKLVGAAANGEASCTTGDDAAANCDTYTLTVSPGNWAGKRIAVRFNWSLPANDYDMVVRQETNGTPMLQGDGAVNTPPLDAVSGTSGNGTNTFEEFVISPPDAGAIYYIRAIYFAVPNLADQYNGTATVESTGSTPPSGGLPPTFDNYQPPAGYPQRDNSGEPSIGINWNTGNVMTMSRLQANRTTFNDSTSPADPLNGATWFPQRPPTIVTGLDPIGFTDPITGRSIFGELIGAGGATDGVISDDDLTTTIATFQTGGPTQGFDHQTIGGGPPNPAVAGRQPIGPYPHLWYYASQQVAYASVATSFDGGLTYQPAVPAYTLAQCNGLHGHIKVAPNDGTVYLPNKGCAGKSGFAVSTDNGLSWTVRTVPTSTAGNTDPSVGIGSGGRVYFAYAGGDNRPHVAVSDDKGITWRDDFDLSSSVTPSLPTPLRAAVFMHAVAGDNDRAAVFFLATNSTDPDDPVGTDGEDATTPPPDPTVDDFAGTWFPYIATTYDGGRSWSVVRADNDPLHAGLPNPVQQGVICTNGTTCPGGPPDTRNLLDFNEMAVDSRGRIVAVYADGCNFDHPCINITNNSATRVQNQGSARLTIIRQRDGRRLYGAFDAGGPSAPPLPPPVQISPTKSGFSLTWATPASGNSPLTAYRIYRGTGGGKEQLIGEVKAGQNRYVDARPVTKGGSMYYKVTAVNAYGESPRNVKVFPSQSAAVLNKAE